MIIFINGSINAGKTTIARLLAARVKNVAIVEVDSLRQMIEWMPIKDSIPLNLENAVAVIKNFSSRGLNVVVPYPLSKENYEYMVDSLRDMKVDIKVFTLAPRLSLAVANRGTRELTREEIERIKYHYEIGIPNPSFGEIIDNSDQSPDDTAEYIFKRLGF